MASWHFFSLAGVKLPVAFKLDMYLCILHRVIIFMYS